MMALYFSPFDTQPHLLAQCQPSPQDTTVELGVNGFGCLGRLVTRAAFNSGKAETVTLSDCSLTSPTWSTCSSMIQPMANSTAQSRLRTGNLFVFFSMENPSPSSRSDILPASNGVILVLSMLWGPLGSSPPWSRLALTRRVGQEGHHLCPSC